MTATEITDFDYETTLEACASGDRHAFKALYERESPRLLGVALRILRDRELANDVLQDAFLQIWQKAGTYRRELGTARGWIYTVVRHRALDEVRRSGREVASGDAIEELADAMAWPAHEQSLSIDAQSLQACLDQLEPDRKACVIRAFVDGYTHEQIAKAIKQPLGTVKSWIRRSLLALKECLS